MLKFLFILFLTGCATKELIQVASPNTVYKYDLKGTVNGVAFDGVGVIPYANVYKMKIESRVDIDLLSITSCHRDFSVESAIKVNWFNPKRGYEYNFQPSEGLENKGSCLVRMTALNKERGINAWGIIDFETPEETLSATSYCNGEAKNTGGVSICQTRAGLVQKIVFEVPVRTSSSNPDSKCRVKPLGDGKSFEYELPSGECVIAFQEIEGKKRIHRHTTISYTDILVRGNL